MTKHTDLDSTSGRDRPVPSTSCESIVGGWPIDDARVHISASDEQVFKAQVCSPDFFDHGREKGHQRFALEGWGRLAERYLAGDLYLRIGAVWGDRSFSSKIRKHYAFIEVSRPRDDKSGVGVFNRKVVEQADAACRANSDQFHVLVDVRHTKDSPQRLVSSIIRPGFEDSLAKIAVEMSKVADQSAVLSIEACAGRQETAGAVPAGKMNTLRFGRALTKSGEGDSSLIKRGPKLVNQLTCQDVHDFWWGRVQDDFREFVSGLRVRIDNDPARVMIEKLPLNAFKLDQMVICSV